MRLSLLALILSCALAFPARAQDDMPGQHMMRIKPLPPVSTLVPVPDDMQQRWILRGCEKGEMSFRFSRRYLLVSVPQGSKLFRLGGLGALGNGRYSMTMPGETSGLMLGSDGRLIQYFGDMNTSFSRAALEARQIMIPHIRHDNCTAATAVKMKEDPVLLSLLPALDALQEACPAPQDIAQSSCQKAVFALFDQGGDETLDKAELKRGWDILISYSPFGTCGPGTTAADSLRGDGDVYIAWILDNLDRDKDGKIAFEDFAPRWREMQAHPLMSGLTNLLIAADRQAGILPESVKVTCVNCCVSAR